MKGLMSGMVTSAKHVAKTQAGTKAGELAKAALEHYQSLGRFDGEKAKIVEMWNKSGKKFQFWSEYSKTMTKGSAISSSSTTGFGTKFQS